MSTIQTLCAALLAALAFNAVAAPQHAGGYEEARRTCEDERNQGQRKKCLRELELQHPRAAQVNEQVAQQAAAQQRTTRKICQDCGQVLGVRVEKRAGESNAIGTVAGGAAGALLGNQIGSGSGKTIATIAGAVGGAYAGRKIQERANATTHWMVDVQYDNGRRGAFAFDQDPGLQRGDRVRNSGQSITRY